MNSNSKPEAAVDACTAASQMVLNKVDSVRMELFVAIIIPATNKQSRVYFTSL